MTGVRVVATIRFRRLYNRVLRDGALARLWPVPALFVVLAVVLGLWLPHLEVDAAGRRPAWLSVFSFDGDAEAARTSLSTIAGSLITVTALTFSLTVLTLQLASTQHSPRLLRTFSRDLVVQVTLGLFLATFTFALIVLRTVRTAEGDFPGLVPRASVSLAYLLALLSVVALLVFLTHLVRQIRVETMLRNVHVEALSTAASILGDRREDAVAVPVPPWARPIPASGSGFFVGVDHAALRRGLLDAGAIALIGSRPGQSIVAGVPVGWAWPDSGTAPLADAALAEATRRVGRAMRLGYERTASLDLSYGLRQLADVAIRALSPGVNDPTTAVHALGHVSALLAELGTRPLGPALLHDEDGTVRACLLQTTWAELLDQGIGQIRLYAAGDPQVLRRLLELLAELAWLTEPVRHDVIVDHLERLRRAIAAGCEDPAELRSLTQAAARVDAALQGHWPIDLPGRA